LPHSARQARRDLVSGGLFVRGIVGHLVPDGDSKTGHAVPTRLGWQQVTSANGITLSDGEDQGERNAHSPA
jgi:hypothetical protein